MTPERPPACRGLGTVGSLAPVNTLAVGGVYQNEYTWALRLWGAERRAAT